MTFVPRMYKLSSQTEIGPPSFSSLAGVPLPRESKGKRGGGKHCGLSRGVGRGHAYGATAEFHFCVCMHQGHASKMSCYFLEASLNIKVQVTQNSVWKLSKITEENISLIKYGTS